MRMRTFAKRCAREILRDPLNLGFGLGFPLVLLALLTAVTIVLGMRMMGAMLISSLIIFPALTAMRLFRSFRGVVICAGVSSVTCFTAGLLASFLFSLPVGASVVVADLIVFLAACLIHALRRR